jgi:hypothetical protein
MMASPGMARPIQTSGAFAPAVIGRVNIERV